MSNLKLGGECGVCVIQANAKLLQECQWAAWIQQRTPDSVSQAESPRKKSKHA